MSSSIFRRPTDWPVRLVDFARWGTQEPTYRDADPAVIGAALGRSQNRPSGNWYVFGASRDVRNDRPFGATVAGVELVAWRDQQRRLVVGPGACPHLGAPLAQARIDCGALVCRWHGLRVSGDGAPGWTALACHDDGILVWVRLDHIGEEPPLAAPVIGARPAADHAISAVATMTGVCEPADIIANRLDPWHGSWFHPYSFGHLEVLESPAPEQAAADAVERFVVAVTFRLGGRLGVPVRAEFLSPEPRTLTMRIIDGEGTGSVVETHATPLGPGPDGQPRTAVIEAVIAHSPRRGFRIARHAGAALRPLMTHAATRLWRDDLSYAERRYQLRTRHRAE
ncbi:DUF5914 domain-containing protein [Nocardia halotolerans]|uniref:DUF5914 domain-containing protein n=1 Tax=Nocardia halotolerans TaxID=1755878 RepID=A0ABV8VDN1_9NOCA